jgi:hypothetical protein
MKFQQFSWKSGPAQPPGELGFDFETPYCVKIKLIKYAYIKILTAFFLDLD